MSFDDYVNHIAQKYRLATAIAVIKSKPDSITLEEYVITLQNKLRRPNMESGFDVSFSSGDFELDSVVDHNDNTASVVPTDVSDHVSNATAANTVKLVSDNNTQTININNPIQQNDSQMTYFEETQNDLISETVQDGPLFNANESTKPESRDKNKENVYFNKSNYINTNDLEETQIYTVPEFIENYSQYSESQCDIIAPVGNKYIINNKKSNIISKEINDEKFSNDYSQNAQDMNLYFDHTPNMDFIFEEHLICVTQNSLVSDSIDRDHNYVETDKENQHNSIRNKTTDGDNNMNVLNDEEINIDESNVEIEERMETNEEIVPFKVIEELNKVKMFLKRRDDKRLDGSASESGYRSDSQGKSFRSASQLSISAMNQSANSLVDYIQTCPITSATRDIVKEMSEILGTLIDKLHEDETYPPFIEVLFETIEISLRQISEGDRSSSNTLSIKDEIFQRILFINKSKNIQKYTINNITKYIEKISNELHDKETYEILNINKIENLCYILYILEIMIMEFTKNKSLPATQTSQDDSKLKRSSLGDVWRRKWNPDCMERGQDGGGKENCVLDYCGEVLNKLTVSCMESYSLVSYSALKCYNLLQTL